MNGAIVCGLIFFSTICCSSLAKGIASMADEFEMHRCAELEHGVNVVFRDKSRMRFLTVMGDYKEFAIRRPSEKGILKFSAAEALEYEPVSKGTGRLTIKLKKGEMWNGGDDPIEFGVISRECWQTIESRFGDLILFREREE